MLQDQPAQERRYCFGKYPKVCFRHAVRRAGTRMGGLVSTPETIRLVRNSWVALRPHSLRDTGSDSFLGDCLSNNEINWRPEAGMPTLPWRAISFALMSRPYSFLLALPSDRTVELIELDAQGRFPFEKLIKF